MHVGGSPGAAGTAGDASGGNGGIAGSAEDGRVAGGTGVEGAVVVVVAKSTGVGKNGNGGNRFDGGDVDGDVQDRGEICRSSSSSSSLSSSTSHLCLVAHLVRLADGGEGLEIVLAERRKSSVLDAAERASRIQMR